MRIMVVRPGPLFSVADVHTGLLKGLRQCGAEVKDVAYDDLSELFSRVAIKQDNGRYKPAFDRVGALEMASEHLQAALYRYWPDVLILTSGFWIPPTVLHVLRARPVHVVAWLTESPYEDDEQLKMAALVDTVVLNDPTNLQRFQEVNPRSFFFPHSYDPDIHHTATTSRTIDVSFVGTGFPSRVEFLEKVDWSGIDLKLGGMWVFADDDSPLIPFLVSGDRMVCMSNVLAADLYRQSRASFNLYRKETTRGGQSDGWAMGPREVELAATGTWFTREPRAEGDDLFPMLPTFTEPGELGDQLRWALCHRDEAEAATRRARRAIADRTFKNTAARALALVDAAPKTLV